MNRTTNRSSLKIFLAGLLWLSLSGFQAFSQADVTDAKGGEVLCVGDDYVNLTDIVIDENLVTDFATGNKTMILGFTGTGAYEFEAGVGTLFVSGAGLSSGGATITSSEVTISVNVTGGASSVINSIIRIRLIV